MQEPRGFSLLEVVISFFVIAVTIACASTMLHVISLSRHARYEDIARISAANELEGLRALGYSSLPASASFTDSLLTTLPSGSGSFTISDYNAKEKQVTVAVAWQEPNAATSTVSLTTLVTSVGGLK